MFIDIKRGLSTIYKNVKIRHYLCEMRWLYFLFLGGFSAVSLAQNSLPKTQESNVEKLTLEKCIQIALSNNLDVQLSAIANTSAEYDLLQSKLNLGPDINGTAGQYYQSGRSIDRFTNQYVQTTIGSNNFQIQGNWILFAGGQLRNAINQYKYNKLATEQDLLQVKQTICLNVSLAYLQCLQGREQQKAVAATVESSKNELDRVQKLLSAGAANEGALWSAKAQYLNNVSNYTQAENGYNSAVNTMKNLLMINSEVAVEISAEMPAVPQNKNEKYSLTELIDSAMNHRPDIKAAQFRLNASEFALKSAKGALLPSLTIGGNLNTVYSGNAKTVTGYSINGTQPIGYVKSTLEVVEAPSVSYTTKTIAFGNQIKVNFGQSFGATMSVPIYGKLQTHTQISQAKLSILRNEISLNKSVQNLKTDVTSAYINYTNSLAKYLALEETHKAQKKNLEFVQIRFQNGQASQFEMQSAQNTEINAYMNLISSNYEYIFRQLVLDFLINNQITNLSNK